MTWCVPCHGVGLWVHHLQLCTNICISPIKDPPCYFCAINRFRHGIYEWTLLFLQWYEKFTEADEVIPVSAKYGHGVDDVKEWILSKLPTGPAYYPKVYISFHWQYYLQSSWNVCYEVSRRPEYLWNFIRGCLSSFSVNNRYLKENF